jgi:hypothetical protein
MAANFTQQTIQQQIAQQSGQIAITQAGGGFQYVNTITGQVLNLPPVSSAILNNPITSKNPKLSNTALALARGYYANTTAPQALVEAIASVAAYVTATQGIPIGALFDANGVTSAFLSAYNSLSPVGSQIGVATINTAPVWENNPTLRGSIAAALTEQA